MPLGTNVTTNPPDEVVVTVTDGGGGSGKTRPVDVHVSWDPAFWRYLSASPGGHECNAGTGVLHWHKRPIPSGSTGSVRLRLRRRRPGVTYIVACAMDPRNGDYKGKKRRFS